MDYFQKLFLIVLCFTYFTLHLLVYTTSILHYRSRDVITNYSSISSVHHFVKNTSLNERADRSTSLLRDRSKVETSLLASCGGKRRSYDADGDPKWYTLTVESGTAYVYSGHYDTRGMTSVVRVIMMADLWRSTMPKYCHVWSDAQKNPKIVKVSQVDIIPETHNKR